MKILCALSCLKGKTWEWNYVLPQINDLDSHNLIKNWKKVNSANKFSNLDYLQSVCQDKMYYIGKLLPNHERHYQRINQNVYRQDAMSSMQENVKNRVH